MFFLKNLIDPPDKNRRDVVEALLIFLVFFLPGYLGQAESINAALFDDPLLIARYLLLVLPQILLLRYLIGIKGDSSPQEFGISPLRFTDFIKGILSSGLIWLCLLPFIIIITFFAPEVPPNPVRWSVTKGWIIPLVFLASMGTGYLEELYFRSYLITTLKRLGWKDLPTVAISTALFTIGHLYQGLPGAIGSMIIGFTLSYRFLKGRSLNEIAIAHGLYNFSVLLLSFLLEIPA